MPSPQELYRLVGAWVQALGVTPHPTARAALAALVAALLTHQSLRPSALMRALPSPRAVPARQRYKRVQRAWTRPWLSSAGLTPALVRAGVALGVALATRPVGPGAAGALGPPVVHLALDSVRCGRWGVFTAGVVWRGRALPVGWAVLPYPWPRGQFTPAVVGLLRRVGAAWPAGVPAHLVADRAFPSRALFGALRALGWGWTVRLRARSWVSGPGQPAGGQPARALLARGRRGGWTTVPAAFGRGGAAVAGQVVVGRGLVVLPAHQRTAGSLGPRGRQAARRRQHLARKYPGRPDYGARAAATDPWVLLFTSHPGPGARRAAPGGYRRRWAIEGSYRDAQGGWDGQHGWDLAAVLARARARAAAHVDRVAGLWALGALLQTWVGHAASQPAAPAAVRAVVAQWTTTGRLSVWAHGHFALHDRSGRLHAWLTATLTAGAAHVAAARAVRPPPGPAAVLPFPPRPPAPAHPRRAA
jgi:hypothetical protein